MGKMKYSEKKLQECIAWVRQHGLSQHGGATLYEFCQEMDITQQCYYLWLEKYKDFEEGINAAKSVFKARLTKEVTNAITRKALGYEDRKREEYGITTEDGDKVVRYKDNIVNVPPDTGACIFLLTNLDPNNWKNRQDNNTNLSAMQPMQLIFDGKEDAEPTQQAIARKKHSTNE